MPIDSQIAGVLRGYDGWEEVYAGRSLAYPLPLTPPSQTGRDPVAAKVYSQLVAQWLARGGGAGADLQDLTANADGIDPWLILGATCKPFQSMLFYFPIGSFNLEDETTTPWQYSIIWRLRNPLQYAFRRAHFSFPQSAPGENQITPTDAGFGDDLVSFAFPADQRLIIPAAVETIVYPEQNSGGSFYPAQGARVRAYNAQFVSPQNYDGQFTFGLLPNIRGSAVAPVASVVTQGVYTPDDSLGSPGYFAINTIAKGDEFIVMLNADGSAVEASPTNWSFTPLPAPNQIRASRIFGRGSAVFAGSSPIPPNRNLYGAYYIGGEG